MQTPANTTNISDLDCPLCVDLDGTLLRVDSAYKLFTRSVIRNPLLLFPILVIWATSGMAKVKQHLAQRVSYNVADFPIHESFYRFLKQEKAKNRTLILVSGTDKSIAQACAKYFGIFSDVMASDGKINLVGKNKASHLVNKFGAHKFDYAGNERKDIYVWQVSRKAYLVGSRFKPSRTTIKFEQVFDA
ncbi:haloacid dehalogenase-like hydrolase [bacterium]|nr:haloacid dehalogenase-like hydrolase [bacterium]